MRVILEPHVEMVGITTFRKHPAYAIPDDGGALLRLGAFAAKGCYDSFGESGRSNYENQRAILEHGHGSVLEHLNVTLFIEGISRGLSLELNRHRTFAISQRSTRYTAEEDAAIVLDPYYTQLWKKHGCQLVENCMVVPERMAERGSEAEREQDLVRAHVHACCNALSAYRAEVERLVALNPQELKGFELRKWARGKARNLLPHALETRGTYTNNVRGWRWFIESRSDRHAEPEIRRLAAVVWAQLMEVAAPYFSDYKAEQVDGLWELTTPYRKV